MRHPRPTTHTCLFLLFLSLATFATNIRADDQDYDEYEETARVARISLSRGDVQLKRYGGKAWELARVNFPLVEGDVLATTGQDARLEIQIDSRNFVRVGGDSILRVVTLRPEGIALSLSEGTATLRLARFDRDKEYFEIDAPGTTLAAEKRGVYRLDVSTDGRVRLTVRDGGQGRIYSETSGFTLRDGRSAELVSNGTDVGDWELSQRASFDSWDSWVHDRERYLASRLKYEDRDRYYDSNVWGAEELDAYGSWSYANDYGWVWRPHVTVINTYNDWAPYRYGHWTWCPPYGWTWVGDEPWGWAPYHYGRWVYYNNGWCWAPRGYGYTDRRAWWRPALVAFVYIPTTYGERVCWYPLTYGQRDPRGRHYRRLEALRSNDIAGLRRSNPAYLRAISSVPARQFGQRAVRAQAASAEIARRAVTAEPILGRLPIAPTELSATANANAPGRRALTARPPRSVGSGPDAEVRPTGAGTRTPGVALDEELRRTRLFQGREPRASSSPAENNGGGIFNRLDPVNTGVLARPARRRPEDIQSVDRGNQRNDANPGLSPWERPARPARENPGSERRQTSTPAPSLELPSGGSNDSAPTPAPAPRVRPRRDDNDGVEVERRPISRPQPPPDSTPEPQPEAPPEPRREPRPEPRLERPEPRYERPEPRTDSRPEPRAEPRPEPPPQRVERPDPPPQREEPRPDPPPQREEQKPDPPQRQEQRPDPAPQRDRGEDRPARPSRTRDNQEF